MFVKNVVDVAVKSVTVSIMHNGSSLFSGSINLVPFYFLNQKVESINIVANNLVIEI